MQLLSTAESIAAAAYYAMQRGVNGLCSGRRISLMSGSDAGDNATWRGVKDESTRARHRRGRRYGGGLYN